MHMEQQSEESHGQPELSEFLYGQTVGCKRGEMKLKRFGKGQILEDLVKFSLKGYKLERQDQICTLWNIN